MLEISISDICEIKDCDKAALKGDRLCFAHHKEAKEVEWLDNTDPHNLGIVKWVKELMPDFAYNEIPEFHKVLYVELLKLYNPRFRNKYERLFEFISFRGSAKSTAANTLFVSYIIANNGKKTKITVNDEIVECVIDERTIVIISETHAVAEDFTVRIRDAFATSDRLRYYYRFAIQQALDSDTGMWTRSAFKINGITIQGVGSLQMIRGKVKGAHRPTLVIADDIYSENTVITEERRTRTRKWWNNAVINSIDTLLGKVVLLGTILHEDTVLVDAENNPLWHTVKIPVMGHCDATGRTILDKFHKFLDDHIKINWELGRAYLPYDDMEDRDERQTLQAKYFDKVQASEDWELQWPEREDLYTLALKFQKEVFDSTTDGFYQEYFHVTSNPEERRFRKEFFQPFNGYDLKFEHGYNWLFIPHHTREWTICNVEFGIDLAGQGRDENVIVVVATLPDLRTFVLHLATGKWSIRDDLQGDTAHDLRRYKVADMDSRNSIRRIGIADEAYRLAKRFRPSKIKIGVAAEEEQIAEEIRRLFQVNRDYSTYVMSRPQTKREGKKEVRILSTLLPYYETRMVYHNIGLSKLEYQLEHLSRTTHDDCADALECAYFCIDFPEGLKYESFSSPSNSNKFHTTNASSFNIAKNFREYF